MRPPEHTSAGGACRQGSIDPALSLFLPQSYHTSLIFGRSLSHSHPYPAYTLTIQTPTFIIHYAILRHAFRIHRPHPFPALNRLTSKRRGQSRLSPRGLCQVLLRRRPGRRHCIGKKVRSRCSRKILFTFLLAGPQWEGSHQLATWGL